MSMHLHIHGSGTRRVMLYTERFHFFRRYAIRGIRHLIFYQPPENMQFYYELLNAVEMNAGETATHATCIMLYTKYDATALERIVGTERSVKIIQASKATHMFC